jgi:hypothetical protein
VYAPSNQFRGTIQRLLASVCETQWPLFQPGRSELHFIDNLAQLNPYLKVMRRDSRWVSVVFPATYPCDITDAVDLTGPEGWTITFHGQTGRGGKPYTRFVGDFKVLGVPLYKYLNASGLGFAHVERRLSHGGDGSFRNVYRLHRDRLQ